MSEQSNITSNQTVDEINLKEILNVIWDGRLFISVVTGVALLISIIYSLNAPKIWVSDALLTTVEATGAGTQGSSKMAGLASMAGINISGAGSDKSSIAIATIQSRDFFVHLLEKDEVLENLMAFESYDEATGISIFNPEVYDPKEGQWLVSKPSYLEAYEAYKGVLGITYNKLNGLMSMTVSHQSPYFAKDFLSLIIQEANHLSRERNLLESKKSLDYLYDELLKTKQSEVVLAISSLIESQLKNQMFARAKDNYLLQPIDTPYVPEQRSSPKRKQIVIFGTFIGLLISTFSLLARYFMSKIFK